MTQYLSCKFKAVWAAITALQAGGGGGGAYTAGDGLDLAANQFSVSGTVARTTGTLSQFAPTTSLELQTLLSDETGSGAAVFNTNAVLQTPRIATIFDSGGLGPVLSMVATGTSVNFIQVLSSSSGTGPTIKPASTVDTNVNLTLAGLGTGVPQSPTAAPGTSTIQIATTAFATAADALKANTASPTFTGTPSGPTATAGTSTTQLSTTQFVSTAIANLVATSPATLDTLNELAIALGNDPNFATTVTTSIGLKANIASPTFTGIPAAPTAAPGTNTTQLATTSFVTAAITAGGFVVSGGALGTPSSGVAINMTVEGTNRIGFRNIPSNPQAAAYTTVLDDSGRSIDHLAADANIRTYTIAGAVAYPIGSCISFSNMTTQAITIAITTDVMHLVGAGTTGSRTLAQFGVATARKQASGVWMISGVNLT